MDEAKKTNRLRGLGFEQTYLSGNVIDIGAGRDLVCPWAEGFDLEHGDANQILRYRAATSYDTVHSSHCLEHMIDPTAALKQWWALLKPGGYLVLVVPDEDLYEQGFWPSRFNRDHKATFTTKREKSWSPVSYNILDLVTALPNAEVLSCDIHDQHYDRSLQTRFPPPPVGQMPWTLRLRRKLIKKFARWRKTVLWRLDDDAFRRWGIPIDQTARDALAQIQVIVKKRVNQS